MYVLCDSCHHSCMNVIVRSVQAGKIAEVVADDVLIHTAQDALDLLFDPSLEGAKRIILRHAHLHPDFFVLKTGLAGEIVQKFVNYGVRAAIVGDFSRATPNMQAFIRESNRGKHLCFCADVETALAALQRG